MQFYDFDNKCHHDNYLHTIGKIGITNTVHRDAKALAFTPILTMINFALCLKLQVLHRKAIVD
jgi:hypothetical protein